MDLSPAAKLWPTRKRGPQARGRGRPRKVCEHRDSAVPQKTSHARHKEGMTSGPRKSTRSLESVTFQDVTVDFTQREWRQLTGDQKSLYREVMLENYENFISLGLPVSKPELISKLQGGGGPWTLLEGEPRSPCPGERSRGPWRRRKGLARLPKS
ncbi:zinc finger protein 74-like isoform X2 [Antechinus flavipes]|uniref:zinc finger protein 74-like isoform X2 n=1 Tax=Antechinus flavipes TaxID=38775 RepID=UPI0022355D59|nr:zinc finger protein 74-like isoform X2 [Antechinus flavipes]